MNQDFLSTFPPNARVLAVGFEPDVLVVDLDGTGEVRVPTGQVTGLFGAGLLRESTHLETERKFVQKEFNSGPLIFGGKSTRLVREVTTKIVTDKDVQPVLALRVTGVPEVWYVQSTSFNYRRTLGPDMSYAAGMNLRTLVRRLADHCPEAFRDEYILAVTEGRTPPEPLDGLLTFLNRVTDGPESGLAGGGDA